MLRRTLAERSIEIHSRASAIGASQFAIDEDRHADFDTAGSDVVIRNQGIDQCDHDRAWQLHSLLGAKRDVHNDCFRHRAVCLSLAQERDCDFWREREHVHDCIGNGSQRGNI